MTTRLTIADLLTEGRDTITVEETAKVLDLSRGSTYQAVRAGTIPSLHVGARWLVPTRQLAALLGVGLDEGDPA